MSMPTHAELIRDARQTDIYCSPDAGLELLHEEMPEEPDDKQKLSPACEVACDVDGEDWSFCIRLATHGEEIGEAW